MLDTSAIHRAISRTRRRLKLQSALEWATLLSIASSALSTLAVVCARQGWIAASSAVALLVAAGALVVIGGVAGYLRPFSQNQVATKIDRSSGLADRLATAVAFEQTLASPNRKEVDTNTEALMRLAMLDATRKIGQAKVKEASPFKTPKDGKAAVAFALVAALVCGISLSRESTLPGLQTLSPERGTSGVIVIASGYRLLSPAGASDTFVFFGEGDTAVAAKIRNISGHQIEFEVPAGLATGMTTVRVRVGNHKTNPRPFEVLDKSDPRAIPEDHIVLEDEDLDYAKDLVAELKETAKANEDLELEELAKEIENLIDQAEEGKLTKKQLLEALAKAEEKYMEGSEESVEEAISDLKEAGKELKKDKLTTELGKALEAGDMDKAKAEMEKLAQKLDDNQLSDKDQEKVGKAMEKAADKMQKAEDKRKESEDKRVAKQQENIRKLEKQRDEAKDEKEREEMVRRLEKEKRELKRLAREKEEKEKDPTKRELKELRRKMKDAAKQLQNQKKDQQEQQKSRREVSKSMRDMARSAGKVSQDQRKMANKPKVNTQMSDLKEAMRRAKRKGKDGPKNNFGRNQGRKKDFGSRARGGQGQKGAWKPGQGQGQGQGQKPGQGQGQGQKPGGEEYGDGHDPNVMGDPTKMSGNTKDEQLQGVRGKGPSTRETILTAAQKGFATRDYEDVFVKYKTIVEEVIKAEKVPSGYKHYVKRYFHTIKPNSN